MSKELIDRIRELQAKDWASPNEIEAADLIEAQQRELRVKDLTIGQMANDMAAAQAQIKVMRDALESVVEYEHGFCTHPDDLRDIAKAALATPTDTTALRELLKAERERCAKVCDKLAYEWRGANSRIVECATAIRAMEDQ